MEINRLTEINMEINRFTGENYNYLKMLTRTQTQTNLKMQRKKRAFKWPAYENNYAFNMPAWILKCNDLVW